MNYCSSPINNLGWHMTVEKMLGITVPKRAQYMRVIMMELARIADHSSATPSWAWTRGPSPASCTCFRAEKIYEIYEEVCGARLTTNMGRVGGMERDFTPVAIDKLRKWLQEFPAVMKEFESMFNRNRIFMDRVVNVGPISAEKALSYGFTGPNLRAAGVDSKCG